MRQKGRPFADDIDQDQTAQNVQSDRGSISSACLVKLIRKKKNHFWQIVAASYYKRLGLDYSLTPEDFFFSKIYKSNSFEKHSLPFT